MAFAKNLRGVRPLRDPVDMIRHQRGQRFTDHRQYCAFSQYRRRAGRLFPSLYRTGSAIVCLVGEKHRLHSGVAAMAFKRSARREYKDDFSVGSLLNLSVVVAEKDLRSAVELCITILPRTRSRGIRLVNIAHCWLWKMGRMN